jgi:hypothetical protein
MDNLNFEWDASVKFNPKEDEAQSLIISGELVNASVCANNFAIDEAELPKLVDQLKDATLRIDHGKSARDVVGGFRSGKYDSIGKRVMFEAEVDEPSIQRSIVKGRLKFISVGATADAFCSTCGKSSKPKICKCKGAHDIIKNIKLKEASIITEPAYQTSRFEPISFVAGLSSALAAEQKVEPQIEAKPISLNKMEERKMSDSKTVEATTLKPAGADAVVVLGEEKLEGLFKRMEKLEERFKKNDEDEAKKKEDEAKKKSEDERGKKEEALVSKFEQSLAAFSTKLEEALKVKVKEDEDEKKKGCKEDEDEAKKKDKATFTHVPTKPGIPSDVKHEPPAKPDEEDEGKTKKGEAKGAKVESANETNVVTGETVPAWFNEIRAFAKKENILD